MFFLAERLTSLTGIPYDEVVDDPQLGSRRQQLVTNAAKALMDAGMVNFDTQSHTLTVTDLGRIAAKYYIRHQSIEIFNKIFKPKMSEADVLAMLSMSTEACLLRVHYSAKAYVYCPSSIKYSCEIMK